MTYQHFMVRSGVWVAVLLCGSVAVAQPNPFDDYEANKPLVGEPAPEKAEPAKPPALKPHLHKGTITLGGEGVFSYTTSNNQLSNGTDLENSTLFLRMAPSVGYFVIDNLEISLAPSLLVRRLDRGSDEPNAEFSWLIEGVGRYHHSLTNRLSVHGGLGLGLYTGSSERSFSATVDGEDRVITENTDAGGVSFTAVAGLGYLLTQNIQLRAGLQSIFLFGSESTSEAEDLNVSTFHIGAGIGLYYLF